MKKLLYTVLIMLLCLTSFMLVSCDGEEDTTTVKTPEFSITYELNGGTNNTENPKTYKTGDTVSLAFPERADYMFAGWYTDSALTNEIKEIKDREESLTLYAKWIPVEDAFELYLYDGIYTIKGLKDVAKTVIIPSSYKGLPVKIYSYMHFRSEVMEELVIPSDTLPFSKHNIFYLSKSLKSITVDEENPYMKSVDGVLFSKDGKTLICYPVAKEESAYTVPNGTELIWNNAFAYNSYVEKVVISDSVTTVGGLAFTECTSLKAIELSSSMEKIDYRTFEKCTSLEKITIPSNIKIIEWGAFLGCTSLKSINMEKGVTIIGELALGGCSSLESVMIPNSVASIHNCAFSECASLKNITIPDSVTSIETGAFNKCISLKSIVIPDSVVTVQAGAFNFCDNLTIYCEAEQKPEGWDENWSNGAKEVVWGYKEEQ